MPPRESKYVVADRSVNRRTVQPASHFPQVAPALRRRATAHAARARLGAPLAEQLQRGATRATPLSRSAIAGAMAGSAGAMTALLGALQGLPLLAAGGACAAAAGFLVAWRLRRHRNTPEELPAVPLFEAADVARLDQAIDALAAEVPAGAAQSLARLKATLLRIARHPAAAQADEHFTLDDRMYVVECVRRYLPDSLEAYLRVPLAQRAAAIGEQPSADALLFSQLQRLADGLRQREDRLALSAAESLQRQERFLQAKR